MVVFVAEIIKEDLSDVRRGYLDSFTRACIGTFRGQGSQHPWLIGSEISYLEAQRPIQFSPPERVNEEGDGGNTGMVRCMG